MSQSELTLKGGEDSMEVDVIELRESAKEIKSDKEVIHELENIADGMESILDFAEDALSSGGMNRATAESLKIALESHTKRLGIEEAPIAPMEDFTEDGSVEATEVTVESIKGTLKSIWQAIKNAIAKTIQAIKNFFAKFFGSSKKGAARVKTFREAIEEIKDKKAKGKVKGSIFQFLHVGGKYTPSVIHGGLRETAAVEKVLYDDYAKAADKYFDTMQRIYATGVESIIENEDNLLNKALTELTESIKKIPLFNREFSGGRWIVMPDEHLFPYLREKSAQARPDHNAENEPLTYKEMKELLDTLDSIYADHIKAERVLDALVSKRDKVLKAADDFAKKAERYRGEDPKAFEKASMALRSANTDPLDIYTDFADHMETTIRAADYLVDQSIDMYG